MSIPGMLIIAIMVGFVKHFLVSFDFFLRNVVSNFLFRIRTTPSQ